MKTPFESSEVVIGNVKIGRGNPIATQSMTISDTLDTEGILKEIKNLDKAGCEIIRITTPSRKEAEALSIIKEKMVEKGIHRPIVADVHFTPNAALIAAKYADKVRINPGNFVDKKQFKEKIYSQKEYQEELQRIETKFIPLLNELKKYNRALRIGVNHGSLSDRIMNYYGDTPKGMVESALEFLRICHKENFKNVVISMKASNVSIMVEAYRQFVFSMNQEGFHFPLHLGVTEAGDKDDGRVKSAIGIGILLLDTIGDTIRVSLTEDAIEEIPVCQRIVENISQQNKWFNTLLEEVYRFRNSTKPTKPIIVVKASSIEQTETLDTGDFVHWSSEKKLEMETPPLNFIVEKSQWHDEYEEKEYVFQKILKKQDINPNRKQAFFIDLELSDDVDIPKNLNRNSVVIVETKNIYSYHPLRKFLLRLKLSGLKQRVFSAGDFSHMSENITIDASLLFGTLLIDHLTDGIYIQSSDVSAEKVIDLSLIMLQAVGKRITKTEYVSCPSCGRTLFDLQETTQKIKDRTDHLKGVKIAVMGCIVNGPGEMADAHFGYVGSGPGVVSLYKGKEVVKKNIPENEAVNQLVELIKENDMWVELT